MKHAVSRILARMACGVVVALPLAAAAVDTYNDGVYTLALYCH